MRPAYVVAIGVAVLVVPAVWMVAASWLFVLLGQLYGELDDPWIAWWLYAASGPTKYTKFLLTVSGILPLAVIGAAVAGIIRWRLVGGVGPVRRRLRGRWGDRRPFNSERGVTDNHGHARWMSIAEAVAMFHRPPTRKHPSWSWGKPTALTLIQRCQVRFGSTRAIGPPGGLAGEQGC